MRIVLPKIIGQVISLAGSIFSGLRTLNEIRKKLSNGSQSLKMTANEYAQAMLDNISKFENDLLANTIFSLFVSLSRCIQDSYENDHKVLQSIVDRKLMRVIRKKKMGLGEKEENHMDIQ